MKENQKSLSYNLFWKLAERIFSQMVSLIISILLARILSPDDFGLLAIIGIFIFFLNIIVSNGMGTSLIQKVDADQLDFSSVFFVNIFLSLILYGCIYFYAPYISFYYGNELLTKLIRVQGIIIIIASINSIQRAYVAKKMLFRFLFISTLSGKFFSGVLGIFLALSGFGIWALISQHISMVLIETYVLWIRLKWRPSLCFSLKRVIPLFLYGAKIILLFLVESIADQLRVLIIGKKYSASDLSYYKQGEVFPNTIVTNIISSVITVTFPALSLVQSDFVRHKEIFRVIVSSLSYSIFPLTVGLALISDILIPFLLTEKWSSAIPFVKIACFTYGVWVIEMPIRNAISSLGKSGTSLVLQIFKSSFNILMLIIMLNKGILMIGYGLVIASIFNIFITSIFAYKFLSYTPLELFYDIFRPLLFSSIMGFGVWCFSLYMPTVSGMFLQILLGIVIYITLLWITKDHFFQLAISTGKSLLHKK